VVENEIKMCTRERVEKDMDNGRKMRGRVGKGDGECYKVRGRMKKEDGE
jgi:hypothetical protein